ncbi:MAG: Coq4 family protein [Archangium sp.]
MASAIAMRGEALEKVEEMPALRRWARGLRALARATKNPGDTLSVLEFNLHVNAGGAPERMARFVATPSGRKLFEERRALDSRTVDLEALERLPDGTLGREYARFMKNNGLSPDIFQAPDNVASPEFAYFAQRMRQTHDLWHVLTGYRTDVPGEVELQAFTYAQARLPGSLLLTLVGTLRMLRKRPLHFRKVLAAWRRGKASGYFPSFPWEEHWATPVAELQRQLSVA